MGRAGQKELFDRVLRSSIPATYAQDADLAHLLFDILDREPGETVERTWKERVQPVLEDVNRAVEAAAQQAVRTGVTQGEDAGRRLRIWLRGRARLHLEHLRMPAEDGLLAAVHADPDWADAAEASERIAPLKDLRGLDGAAVVAACLAAGAGADAADPIWWRMALELARQPEAGAAVVRHAEVTGAGLPGSAEVRRLHLALLAAGCVPGVRHAEGHGPDVPDAIRSEAASLPRHWRLLLLSGADAPLWLDVLSDLPAGRRLVPGGAGSGAEAEAQVTALLAGYGMRRDVRAEPSGAGWLVRLVPLPDDLPGRLPGYVIRPGGRSPRRIPARSLPEPLPGGQGGGA